MKLGSITMRHRLVPGVGTKDTMTVMMGSISVRRPMRHPLVLDGSKGHTPKMTQW